MPSSRPVMLIRPERLQHVDGSAMEAHNPGFVHPMPPAEWVRAGSRRVHRATICWTVPELAAESRRQSVGFITYGPTEPQHGACVVRKQAHRLGLFPPLAAHAQAYCGTQLGWRFLLSRTAVQASGAPDGGNPPGSPGRRRFVAFTGILEVRALHIINDLLRFQPSRHVKAGSVCFPGRV